MNVGKKLLSITLAVLFLWAPLTWAASDREVEDYQDTVSIILNHLEQIRSSTVDLFVSALHLEDSSVADSDVAIDENDTKSPEPPTQELNGAPQPIG